MNYENQNCPVCNNSFTENDDIVVCPECGTPHHRECWNLSGRCANEQLHSQGFEWKKSELPVNEAPEEQQKQSKPDENNVFTIPNPLKQTPDENMYENICMNGVPADREDIIDGIRVGDAALFIQQSARNYIRKYKKKSGVKFNWAALFFAPAWFFYRKLYKAGAIFLAAVVAISLFTYPVAAELSEQNNQISEYISASEENGEALSYSKVAQLMNEDEKFVALSASYLKNSLIIISAKVIPNIIAAFIADKLYWKKIKKDISATKELKEDSGTEKMIIMQKGGVSLIIGAVIFIAYDYIVPALLSASDFIMNIFK